MNQRGGVVIKSQRELELIFGEEVRVVDRTALILDIFALHARTREGALQVELAQYRYLLPRLAGQWSHLERLGGGIGTRGPGESQLETDRRLVRQKIKRLEARIEAIRQHRALYRENRRSRGIPVVALVGYTNAGKSTLLNALSKSSVLVADRLFSTLDPVTRRITLRDNTELLLTDTVGFIDRLPLTLIEAFRSTLEETIYANLILLVVDASEPESIMEKKLVVCFETIDRIGASGIPIITVFNKIDLLSEAELKQKLGDLREKALNAVPISALRGTNFDRLKNEVLRILKNYVRASFSVPMTEQVMPFISWLFKSTDVRKVEYTGDSVNMVFEASPELAEKVRNRVEAFKGRFEKHPG